MENNIVSKKENRKVKWTVLIILFIVNLACLGLFIWGIVELVQGTGKTSDIKGGLLIGVDLFIMLFSIINISSFLTNNPQYKNDFMNFFKSKKNKQNNDPIKMEEQYD